MRLAALVISALLCCVGCTADPTAAAHSRFAYVINQGAEGGRGGYIAAYKVNPSTGALTPSARMAVGDTLAFQIDPAGRFVYRLTLNPAKMLLYTIDPATGRLLPEPGSPFASGTSPAGPAALLLDPKGRFAYAADSLFAPHDKVFGYAVNGKTGRLKAIPGSPFPDGSGPGEMAIDPSGKFAYVADQVSNGVTGFAIDQGTGALTAMPGSPYTTADTPTGLAIHPSAKFLYYITWQNVSVPNDPAMVAVASLWADTIDPASGKLEPVPGSPFSAGDNVGAIQIDPSGRFAYVLNGDHSNVAAWTIDQNSGALTPMPGAPWPAGKHPLSMTISDRFVYMLNGGSIPTLSTYTIDVTTGALKRATGSAVAAGPNPGSVFVTPDVARR